MAKIKGPLNSIQASGTVGGVTYGRNQFGSWARPYYSTTQPVSTDQGLWRLAVQLVSIGWANNAVVTPARRQAWYSFAETFTASDKFGNQVKLGAKEWFVKFNVYLTRANFSLIPDPPPSPGCAWSPEVDFFWDTDGIFVEIWPPPIHQQLCYIGYAGPKSPQRFAPGNDMRFCAIAGSFATYPLKVVDAADIDTDPHSWFFRVICVDLNGRPSNAVYYRVYTEGSPPSSVLSLTHANQIRPANPNSNFLDQSVMQFSGSSIASPKTNLTDLVELDISALSYSKVSRAWLYSKGSTDGANPNTGGFLLYDTILNYTYNQVTWNERATGTNWSTPGGAPGVDYAQNPFFGWTLGVVDDTWYRFDLTDQFNVWLDTVSTVQFWVIASGTDANGVFWSTGAGSADDRPYFITIPNLE